MRGSVFVEHCENCTFELGCGQLRVHETRRCEFVVFVESDPVIEDSSELVFAPNDCIVSHLPNMWDRVKDFNCPVDQGKNYSLRK